MRIRKSDFLRDMQGKEIKVDDLANDRSMHSSVRNRLKTADANRDGFIKGDAEMGQLFGKMDHYDRNGDRNSVDTRNANVMTIHQALIRNASDSTTGNATGNTDSTGSTGSTGSTSNTQSPLARLVSENPRLRTNQDLLNFFLGRHRNNWNAASREAREYGVNLASLTSNRRGAIDVDRGNDTGSTTGTGSTDNNSAVDTRSIGNVAGIQNTSPAFRAKVVAVADRLRMSPRHLMAVMSFETGETFSSSVRNRHTGATGLIQFMPATARHLGTSTSRLARMSPERQLDYVERYLKPYAGRMNTVEDAYMAVLWPAAVGDGPNRVLFRSPSRAYRQNSGLDINRNGAVTAREAAAKVRSKLR